MYLDRLDSYYSIDHYELKEKTKPKKDNNSTIGKISLLRMVTQEAQE